MVKKAVILAGGLGTRIKHKEPDVPKELIKVSDYPLIHYIIIELKRSGVEEFIFCLGHKSALVSAYLKKNFNNLKYEIVTEDKVLGTGGAVLNVFDSFEHDTYLVVNGDTYVSYDIFGFSDFHFFNLSEFSLVSVTNDIADRYGNLKFRDKKVIEFIEKRGQSSGWINAGHYLINSNFYQQLSFDSNFTVDSNFSIESLMEGLAASGKLYGYKITAPFIDIGVPEDLLVARNEYKWPKI